MSRTVADVLKSLVAKLPLGWALRRRGGTLDAVLTAPAEAIAALEVEAERLMAEVDPRTAVALLPDFERVLGPDPCARDLAGQTFEQRQRMAHQRWTARGGQSIPYFVDLAARLGTTITVEEFWPSVAGVLVAGDALVGDGEQFTWRVKLDLVSGWLFRAGQNTAGDPLGSFQISDIECVLRRLKPAHTVLVFSYVAGGWPEEWGDAWV